MFGKLGRCANKRTEVVRFNQPLTGGLLFLIFWYGTSGLKSWVSFPYLSILWCGGTDPCIGSGPWIHLLPASGAVAIANVRVRGSWRIRLLMRWDGIVLEKYYLCLRCCLGMASQESSPCLYHMSMQRSRFEVTLPNLAYFRDRGKLTSTSLENCFLFLPLCEEIVSCKGERKWKKSWFSRKSLWELVYTRTCNPGGLSRKPGTGSA